MSRSARTTVLTRSRRRVALVLAVSALAGAAAAAAGSWSSSDHDARVCLQESLERKLECFDEGVYA